MKPAMKPASHRPHRQRVLDLLPHATGPQAIVLQHILDDTKYAGSPAAHEALAGVARSVTQAVKRVQRQGAPDAEPAVSLAVVDEVFRPLFASAADYVTWTERLVFTAEDGGRHLPANSLRAALEHPDESFNTVGPVTPRWFPSASTEMACVYLLQSGNKPESKAMFGLFQCTKCTEARHGAAHLWGAHGLVADARPLSEAEGARLVQIVSVDTQSGAAVVAVPGAVNKTAKHVVVDIKSLVPTRAGVGRVPGSRAVHCPSTHNATHVAEACAAAGRTTSAKFRMVPVSAALDLSAENRPPPGAPPPLCPHVTFTGDPAHPIVFPAMTLPYHTTYIKMEPQTPDGLITEQELFLKLFASSDEPTPLAVCNALKLALEIHAIVAGVDGPSRHRTIAGFMASRYAEQNYGVSRAVPVTQLQAIKDRSAVSGSSHVVMSWAAKGDMDLVVYYQKDAESDMATINFRERCHCTKCGRGGAAGPHPLCTCGPAWHITLAMDMQHGPGDECTTFGPSVKGRVLVCANFYSGRSPTRITTVIENPTTRRSARATDLNFAVPKGGSRPSQFVTFSQENAAGGETAPLCASPSHEVATAHARQVFAAGGGMEVPWGTQDSSLVYVTQEAEAKRKAAIATEGWDKVTLTPGRPPADAAIWRRGGGGAGTGQPVACPANLARLSHIRVNVDNPAMQPSVCVSASCVPGHAPGKDVQCLLARSSLGDTPLTNAAHARNMPVGGNGHARGGGVFSPTEFRAYLTGMDVDVLAIYLVQNVYFIEVAPHPGASAGDLAAAAEFMHTAPGAMNLPISVCPRLMEPTRRHERQAVAAHHFPVANADAAGGGMPIGFVLQGGQGWMIPAVGTFAATGTTTTLGLTVSGLPTPAPVAAAWHANGRGHAETQWSAAMREAPNTVHFLAKAAALVHDDPGFVDLIKDFAFALPPSVAWRAKAVEDVMASLSRAVASCPGGQPADMDAVRAYATEIWGDGLYHNAAAIFRDRQDVIDVINAAVTQPGAPTFREAFLRDLAPLICTPQHIRDRQADAVVTMAQKKAAAKAIRVEATRAHARRLRLDATTAVAHAVVPIAAENTVLRTRIEVLESASNAPVAADASSTVCSVCAVNDITIILLPCNHATVCTDCLALLNPRICPCCRAPVQGTAKFYLAPFGGD